MPTDLRQYPPGWASLSRVTRAHHGNRCLSCSKPDGEEVVMLFDGSWQAQEGWRDAGGRPVSVDAEQAAFARRLRVRLAVAHLDQNPANCSPENLATLCQWCHGRYDAYCRRKNKSPLHWPSDRDGERSAMAPPFITKYRKTEVWFSTTDDGDRSTVWLDDGGGRWCIGEVERRGTSSWQAMHLDRTLLGPFISGTSAVYGLAHYSTTLTDLGRLAWEQLGALPGMPGAAQRLRVRIKGRLRIPPNAARVDVTRLVPAHGWWMERVGPSVAEVLQDLHAERQRCDHVVSCLRDWLQFRFLIKKQSSPYFSTVREQRQIREEQELIAHRQVRCVRGGNRECPWTTYSPEDASDAFHTEVQDDWRSTQFDQAQAWNDYNEIISAAAVAVGEQLAKWRAEIGSEP